MPPAFWLCGAGSSSDTRVCIHVGNKYGQGEVCCDLSCWCLSLCVLHANHVKAKINLNYRYRYSSYRAVNTFCLGYEKELVTDLYRNNRCFFFLSAVRNAYVWTYFVDRTWNFWMFNLSVQIVKGLAGWVLSVDTLLLNSWVRCYVINIRIDNDLLRWVVINTINAILFSPFF